MWIELQENSILKICAKVNKSQAYFLDSEISKIVRFAYYINLIINIDKHGTNFSQGRKYSTFASSQRRVTSSADPLYSDPDTPFYSHIAFL